MSERILSGGNGAFMTVRHLVLRGTNAEIGAQLARIAAERHGVNVDQLRAGDPGRACGQAEYMAKHAPVLWKRAQGVARALGLDPQTCDATALPYNQLPAGLASCGCSLVYYPPAVTSFGHAALSRNFDFAMANHAELFGLELPADIARGLPPMMADPYLLELHPSDGGYGSLSTVSFDLLSGVLDGVNEEGLVVAVNADEVAMSEGVECDPQGVGLHELACMRVVLDSCATAAEARDLLVEATHYVAMMPCHYLVADRHGSAFILEWGTDGTLQITEAGPGPTLLLNHPVYRFPDRGAFPPLEDQAAAAISTFARGVVLEDAVSAIGGVHGKREMTRATDAVSIESLLRPLARELRKRLLEEPGMSRTLWHVLYDAEERSASFRFYVGEKVDENGTLSVTRSAPVRVALGG